MLDNTIKGAMPRGRRAAALAAVRAFSGASRGRAAALAVFAALALVGIGGTAQAATTLDLGMIENLKVSGDLRLRHEYFNKRTKGQADRSRQRFRLRLGTELPFKYGVSAKLRFASGTGEQVSTNQSLDNTSGQKEFWIDRAFLEWKPNEVFKVAAGRMANPLWTITSSDAVWDDDFNPEGFSENVKLSLFGSGRVFLNALQMVVDEDSSDNNDQWLFSQQIGIELPLFAQSRFRVAGAVHNWVNESTTSLSGENASIGNFSQPTTNEGNRRYSPSGVLQNEFRVVEVTGEYLTYLMSLPLSLQGTYIQNAGALDSISPSQTKEDTGYQTGLILGKASAAKSWEVAYFYKLVETDATVADVSDSDFGDGGTNRRGHIVWLAYNPHEWMQAKVKAFQTKVDNVALSPGRDDINRFQFDVSVKF